MIASRIITTFNLIKQISIAISSKAVAWAVLNPINSDMLGNVIDRLASRVSDAFKHFLKGSFCLRCDLATLLKFLLAFVVQGVEASGTLIRKKPSLSDLDPASSLIEIWPQYLFQVRLNSLGWFEKSATVNQH